MASKSRSISVKITGDASDLERALGASTKGLGRLGTEVLGTFGGNLLTKGFDTLVGGLKSAAGWAMEGVDKLDGWGDAIARLEAQAAGLGDVIASIDLAKWGVDKTESAAAAAEIANMAKSLGLTDDELKSVTPAMTELAAKMASLGDGNPEAVAKQLAAALKGSTKAAGALGVELPKGAKGLEAYTAIMAQLGPQIDQATSGTRSLADVGATWDATLTDLQLELAGYLDTLAPVISAMMDALLPAFRELVGVVGPALAAVFGSISEALSGMAEGGAAQYVTDLLRGILKVAKALGTFLFERVVPVFLELANAIGEALAPVLPIVEEAFAAWMPVLSQVWGFVESVIVPLLTRYVIPALGKVLEVVATLAKALGGALSGALSGISRGFDRLMGFIRPVIDALRKVADLAGSVGGKLGSISLPFGIGKSSGAGRSGGIVVNVTAGIGDPVSIGREVSRVLGAYSSRSGHMVTV
jgi:hypothetical protein